MKKTVMLKKNYEFRKVFSKGKIFRGKLFDIYIIKNNIKLNKLGIAIGKKAGNSVKRNKIKRLIRENYKNIESKISLGNSIVIVWKQKADFEKYDFYSIKQELENSFIKMKIM